MKNLAPVVFCAGLLLSFHSRAQNADIDLLHAINRNGSTGLTNTSIALSHSVTPVMIAEPLGIFICGLVKKDSTLKRKSYVIGASLLSAGAISTGLKYLVNRDRPFVTYPFIIKKMDVETPSFPSGHTSGAFSVAASLTFAFPKWYVAAPSFLWAAAVGYSRMEVGVHYPSDVLVGALIGAGSSWLMWEGNNWLQKKRVQKS